jgi:hypothetical protein
MRRAALGMLAASSLAGCNLVFGLKETSPNPDGPPADAAGRAIHLAFLQASLDSDGQPLTPTEIPIDDLEMVSASALDGSDAVSLTPSPDGTLSVPLTIADATAGWRLFYQRPNQVVRELQNLPADAHVVEPLFGPLERVKPASNSGFSITPLGYPVAASHALNRVFTTGIWSEGTTIGPPPGATLAYGLADAVSSSGAMGTPGPDDRGLLFDYLIDAASTCRSSTGSMDFSAANSGPPLAPVSGSWKSDSQNPTVNTSFQLAINPNLKPFGEVQGPGRQQLGYVPNAQMPAFTRPPLPVQSLVLRNPVMIALRSCPLPTPSNAAQPPFVESAYLDTRLKRAVHTEVTATRQLPNSATVYNGLAILTLDDGGAYDVVTDVAFPEAVTIRNSAGVTADLFGAADGVAVAAGSGPLTVSWKKTVASATADFWEVTLIELPDASASLLPRRTYVTSTTSLTIQPVDVVAGHTYVLAFTAFTGLNRAPSGDFRAITGAQSISIIHARSFVVQ